MTQGRPDIDDRMESLSPERRALLAKLLRERTAAAAPAPAGLPRVEPDPGHRYDPFPLTGIQQAYWLGRSGIFELGDVASHSFLEIDVEGARLPAIESALRRLIVHHEMLRMVVTQDGQQRILAEVEPYRMEVTDLSAEDPDEVEVGLQVVRDRMSHQVLPSDTWPLFEVRASRMPGGRARLHLSLDALIFDGWSLHLFLTQWGRLVAEPGYDLAPVSLTPRDYVLGELALRETEAWRRARDYWMERIESGSIPGGPALPLARDPAKLDRTRFVRRRRTLDQTVWNRVKDRARKAGLTPTGVLLAAYVDVLSIWSETPRFTINIPQFNRLPIHDDVQRIVGEFANFTLLVVEGDATSTFEQRALRVQERLWRDLDHALFTGLDVVRELAQRRGSEQGASMPVIFTGSARDAEGRDAYATTAAKALGDCVFAINQTSQVWLDNHVFEEDGVLVCDWDTVEALFPAGMQEAMLGAFLRHLQGLAEAEAWSEDPHRTAARVMPPVDWSRREPWNDLAVVHNVRLHEAILAAEARAPGAIAVRSSRRTLTYRELAALSGGLALNLADRGIGPGSLVAIAMEKGWEQVVAVLAVIRAGAAYLPVDADLPPERLRYVLENGGAQVALTQSGLDEGLAWPDGVERIRVDEWEEEGQAPDVWVIADDLACVIYTSGSTGLPKGVMITHRNIANAINWANQFYTVGEKDVAIALTALHHDLSFYDLFGLLVAGGSIAIPDADERRDPAAWSRLMVEHRVTVWNSVPAMMEMMLEYADEHPGALGKVLRAVILGGDWVPLTIPDHLRAYAPRARLTTIGGPTETTLWNIWNPVDGVDPSWASIPYGRAIPGNRYYVVDENLVDRAVWVPGELCCTGVQVTRGYWQDEERTAEKYVMRWDSGEVLYRTGDRGRFRPDGTIEFLGRIDLQVKVQGQRIELGEIEAILGRHPAVKRAVATATGDPMRRRGLAAYVVLQRDRSVDEDALSVYLAEQLPPHMIPVAWVFLDAFPLTANGKVDRLALPDPMAVPREAAERKRGGGSRLVARVSAIVAEILDVHDPDPDQRLVYYGANSLDMVRIGNRLEQELGRRPRIDELFRLSTITALADYYEGDDDGAPDDVGDATDVDDLVASYQVILDPDELAAFKKQEPGLRKKDAAKPFIALEPPADPAVLEDVWLARRSYRRFVEEPVPFQSFEGFLSALMRLTPGGKPKYLYPSPGGLYPVQTYLHVKPGRVEGVAGGTYYYDPSRHRLVVLVEDGVVDAGIHIPFINSPIFESAAFSVFLVAQIDAIAPSYGEHTLRFCHIEAGAMSYLLETAALENGLGLCYIGSVDFERVRHLFDLDPTHVLVHSLLGGAPDPAEETPWSAGEDDEEEGVL